LIRRSIDSLESGNLEALPQDPALASKAPRLKKTDGEIDWTRPAEAIRNQIRAFDPWPKTYTFWQSVAGSPLRLIVGRSRSLRISGQLGISRVR
jgi:methionyl-tRNA formyltransferase